MLRWHLVEELPESLVALAAVAHLVGHAAGARGDVGGPVLLANVIKVACLGRIQAVVPFGNVLNCKRRGKAGVISVPSDKAALSITVFEPYCNVPGSSGVHTKPGCGS